MEVVVATGVFALMSIALLEAVAQVQTALIETRTTGTREAARRFALRRVLAATSQEIFLAGNDLPLDTGGSVKCTVRLGETHIPDLHRVGIDLDWGDGETETLSLWVYRPEWSTPDTRSALLQNLREQFPQSRFSTY
jgi:hypothetical protein